MKWQPDIRLPFLFRDHMVLLTISFECRNRRVLLSEKHRRKLSAISSQPSAKRG